MLACGIHAKTGQLAQRMDEDFGAHAEEITREGSVTVGIKRYT